MMGCKKSLSCRIELTRTQLSRTNFCLMEKYDPSVTCNLRQVL